MDGLRFCGSAPTIRLHGTWPQSYRHILPDSRAVLQQAKHVRAVHQVRQARSALDQPGKPLTSAGIGSADRALVVDEPRTDRPVCGPASVPRSSALAFGAVAGPASYAMLLPSLWRAGAVVRTHDVAGHLRSLWLPIRSSVDDPASWHFAPERFS